jgi:hypothetical protein
MRLGRPRLSSKYNQQPMSFAALKTVPIADRGGKVTVDHMAKPYVKGSGITGLLDSLPDILAAPGFCKVVDALIEARNRKRALLWGIGGHVIKCGLAPVLLDLMRRGFITGFVMNGAASIHDFEMAIAGQTSEDVEAVLPDGRFGAAEETGREMNLAINEAARVGIGMGEGLGVCLDRIALPQFAGYSIVLQAWRASVPVTVHVAMGTDTPHTHAHAEGSAIGACTHHDFRLLCSMVREIHDGGVYLNVGSAVVLPEVFLKAVSVVRNLGHSLARFTTVNMDFLQHYRPKLNVVERPHAQREGKGYAITGHHELMVPLLAAALIERSS